MEGHGLLFREWNDSIARISAVTGVLDLPDHGLVPCVNDLHPSHFFVRLAGLFQQFSLPRIGLIFVHVAQRAQDLVLRAGSIPGSSKIDNVTTRELRGGRRL